MIDEKRNYFALSLNFINVRTKELGILHEHMYNIDT